MPVQFGKRASTACVGGVVLLLASSIFLGGADGPMATSMCVLGLLLLAAVAAWLNLSVPMETLFLGGLLGVAALSGLAGNWDMARTEWLQLCGAVAIWTAGRTLGTERYLVKLSWYALMGTLMAIGLLAILAYGLDVSGGLGVSRMKFTFGSPNSFAALMAVGAILSVGHISYKLTQHTSQEISLVSRFGQLPGKTILSMSALVVCGGCVMLSLSRAGFVLMVLACLFVALVSILSAPDFRRYWKRLIVGHPFASAAGLLAACFMVALLLGAETQFGARASDLHVDAMDRWAAFGEYWSVWQQKPLIGHGLGSFNHVNERLTNLENAPYLVTLGAAHNVGLQWLIQTGLVGTALMAAIWLAMHFQIIRALRKRAEGANFGFIVAVLAVSVYFSIHSMIDFPLELPGIMWIYSFVLGLACGVAASEIRKSEAERVQTQNQT